MKLAFLPLFLLLLPAASFAITGNDAVNLVVNSNNFLYEAETYTPPNVAISYEDSGYWVIPLTAGSNIVTYFPVDAQSGEISISRGVNRGVFGVADSLRELQLLKASISGSSGVEWLFTQKYQSIFNDLSLQIGDEVFQLNTAESTLKSSGISANLEPLKSKLRSMSSASSSISGKIADASQAENSFATSPSPEALATLNGSFSEVFGSIGGLYNASLEYRSELDKLKQEISLSDMEAEKKAQLFSILEIPSGMQALRNYNIDATQIKESLDSSFKASSLRLDSLLGEFEDRLLKNDVHKLLYGENEKIRKETGFISLTEAKNSILLKENRANWEDQQKVKELEQDYSRASSFYGERDFEQARKYALESIGDVVSVYKKGQKKALPQGGVSQDLLFKAAGVLILLLALLYVFNNRGKLKGMVLKEPEEVDLYA